MQKQLDSDYKRAKAWMLSQIGRKDFALHPRTTLKRIGQFLFFLGNPQDKYKSVHIAGTSGKGSTALFLQRILSFCGLATGAYIKPYLQEPVEKLSINSRFINKKDFSDLVFFLKERYEKYLESFDSSEWGLGYKDLWMVLGHLFFASRKVDFGVIETSMGGLYDPSNLILPEVCIITTVDLDHTKHLGNSLQSIARHKAGIIKKGVPVVVGRMRKEAFQVVKNKAKESCAKIMLLGRDFDFKIKKSDSRGSVFDLRIQDKFWRDIFIPLQGDFQVYNCSLASAAVFILSKKFGFSLPQNLSKVFSGIRFPGRMELMQKEPLVIFDLAHNRQKLKSAFSFLAKNYAEVSDRTLVLGLLKNKDPEFFLHTLSDFFNKIVITEPKVFGRRVFSSEELCKIALKYKKKPQVYCFKEPIEALDFALNNSKKSGLIFATGSVFLIGNLRKFYFPNLKSIF